MLSHFYFGFFAERPASIDIELSNRCNLKCRMCWFHGENGVGDRYRDTEMTTEEILGLLDQLALHKPRLYLGGGEPFIREDIMAILEYAKRLDFSVSLTTNGTLLDQEKIGRLVDLGVDVLNFSIDGNEAVHDQLRGKGSFSKATSAIKQLLAYRRERNEKKPFVYVNITINPLNAGHLQDTFCEIRKAIDGEADHYRIHHLWFITSSELQEHKKAVQRYLSAEAPGAKAHLIPSYQEIDTRALADEISRMESGERIRSFPALRGKEIQQFYSEGYRPGKRCVASFRTAVIKPNGDVKFCPDEWIDDYVLGNIRKERFDDIWNNEKARRFRSVILRRKSFPGCKRCSWMHCF